MGERTRGFDWTTTPLGAPETWPESLKTAVNICLGSRHPIVMWWDEDDLTQFYNDAFISFLGHVKHPAALGQSGRDCWSEIWPIMGPMLESVFATGEATWSEDFLYTLQRHLPQEEGYFTFSYSPIRDGDGPIRGIFCACTETTDRVIGERRLRTLRDLGRIEAEAKTVEAVCDLAALALAGNPGDIPFGLIYLVEDGSLAEGGSDHARLVSTIGPALDDTAAPGRIDLRDVTKDAPPWPLAEVFRVGQAVLVTDVSDKFGWLPGGMWPEPADTALIAPIAASVQAVPFGFLVAGLSPRRLIDDDYKTFLHLVAGQIGACVTSARAYDEERRRAEALAELNRAKTVFFSNISHEFRTPLTLMLGPLDELRQTQSRTEDRALVETAQRNGLRLLKLVNTLLDFSRIEAGRFQATYRPTDLASFTAEIASSFRSAVERAGLQLVIDCPPLDQPVYVDPDMWEKIVLNLLSNAFKFTFEGEIGVSILPASDEASVELTVRDTGTGIAPDELPRLFERFHRIEGAAGRTVEGSGIGLALVQELVKLHGGGVTVSSAVGGGSQFTVSIPYGSTHLPADRVREERTEARLPSNALAFTGEAARWQGADASDETLWASSIEETVAGTPERPEIDLGRVLLADDNTDLRDYVSRLLAQQGYSVEAVADGDAAFAAAQREAPGIIVSDVMMPKLDGLGLVRKLRYDPALREIPIILLSARAGEEAQIEGLASGVDDYLSKPFTARELLARVASNLRMARLRREAADALRVRTGELETVLATVPAAVWFTRDPDAIDVRGNREAAALLRIPVDANPSLTGTSRQHFRVFRNGREMPPEALPIRRAAHGEEVHGEEFDLRFDDDTSRTLRIQAKPLRETDGTITGAVAAAIDVTGQRTAEAALRDLNEALEERVAAEIAKREEAEIALRQVQKMEAIGQLTGGVAHDFNNLLTIIMGNMETLERRLPPNPDWHRLVSASLRGASRAALLTHGLLAFSRRQPLAPKVLWVNDLVAGMEEILRRTLDETISVETVLAEGLWPTFVDANQLENAVLNLAVNARDAMPDGGKLTIRTANCCLDNAGAAIDADVTPGEYIGLFVGDTGTGMAPDVIGRVFDPFFTTKEPGQGTGLGLSQVYGFAKQSDGQVKIDSALGRGTVIKIYLPRYHGDLTSEAEYARIEENSQGRGEMILVVEDDPDVRSNAVEILGDLGYRVLTADNGVSALPLLDAYPEIGVLFTDVILPGGMNGRQLVEVAVRRHPQLKVLYTTGYSRDAIVHHGRLDPGVDVIYKPFRYAEIAAKLRAVLRRRDVAAD